MGSYNWSKGAASNSEDLNVVTSAEVAETYARHWQAMQALSIRFADASQWCRRRSRRLCTVSACRRSVPLTTILICRLPHCEQTSRSRQSRTGVPARCWWATWPGSRSTVMAARPAPDDQPKLGFRRIAERHRRAGFGPHLPAERGHCEGTLLYRKPSRFDCQAIPNRRVAFIPPASRPCAGRPNRWFRPRHG